MGVAHGVREGDGCVLQVLIDVKKIVGELYDATDVVPALLFCFAGCFVEVEVAKEY